MANDFDNPPRRILIFGGTFDPPHLAHAMLPAQAAQLLQCDRILYVPAAINPLKTDGPTASGEHRMAMLLLAIADVPNAKISTIELDREGPSYTVDTLRALKQQWGKHQGMEALRHRGKTRATGSAHGSRAQVSTVESQSATHGGEPGDTERPEGPEFHLLIGCDQALDFHRWKNWQEILMLATPAVMVRPPWNLQTFTKALHEKYSKVEAESWLRWTLRLPQIDVSSTQVREHFRSGDLGDLDEALDPAVHEYIRRNRLYE